MRTNYRRRQKLLPQHNLLHNLHKLRLKYHLRLNRPNKSHPKQNKLHLPRHNRILPKTNKLHHLKLVARSPWQ